MCERVCTIHSHRKDSLFLGRPSKTVLLASFVKYQDAGILMPSGIFTCKMDLRRFEAATLTSVCSYAIESSLHFSKPVQCLAGLVQSHLISAY